MLRVGADDLECFEAFFVVEPTRFVEIGTRVLVLPAFEHAMVAVVQPDAR